MMTIRHLFVALGIAALAVGQTAPGGAGHWQGKIQMGARELPVTVDLARNPQGAWIGSMSLTGTTSIDVPVSAVKVDATTLHFEADLPMHASFDGKFAADGNSVAGMAKNADGEVPFSLTRSGDANVKTAETSSPMTKEFEGEWSATLESGGRTRQAALRLSAGTDGKAKAILIAGEQKTEFPVSTVTIKGKEISLDVRVISGSYRGTLNENGEIAGEWTEGGGNHMPVTFKRVASR